ncbi:hypothetical protein [Phenylobacterium sp.]|uniref:hypothetical protein n=1 Tax=Phenylobacterium sp. TaxID=1871053 RepID=UPI002ED82BD2
MNYLRSVAAIEAYLRGAMLENDPAYLAYARLCAALAVNRWRIQNLPPELRLALDPVLIDAVQRVSLGREPAPRRARRARRRVPA